MSDRPFLLDTNVVVIWCRGGDNAEHIRRSFGPVIQRHPPLVSVVTHAEILVLEKRNNWGTKRMQQLHDLLDRFVTVDLVPEVVEAYVDVEMYSSRVKGGARKMGKNDVWIAASAKAAEAKLLTYDGDFDHLAGGFISVERLFLAQS